MLVSRVVCLDLSHLLELSQLLLPLDSVDTILELLMTLLLLPFVNLVRADFGVLPPKLPSLVPQQLYMD